MTATGMRSERDDPDHFANALCNRTQQRYVSRTGNGVQMIGETVGDQSFLAQGMTLKAICTLCASRQPSPRSLSTFHPTPYISLSR